MLGFFWYWIEVLGEVLIVGGGAGERLLPKGLRGGGGAAGCVN